MVPVLLVAEVLRCIRVAWKVSSSQTHRVATVPSALPDICHSAGPSAVSPAIVPLAGWVSGSDDSCSQWNMFGKFNQKLSKWRTFTRSHSATRIIRAACYRKFYFDFPSPLLAYSPLAKPARVPLTQLIPLFHTRIHTFNIVSLLLA